MSRFYNYNREIRITHLLQPDGTQILEKEECSSWFLFKVFVFLEIILSATEQSSGRRVRKTDTEQQHVNQPMKTLNTTAS